MAITFVSGNSRAFDHTPAAAVSAGDVVVQTGLVGIAKLDIAADALGALHTGAVWSGTLNDGHSTIAVGSDLYWDADGNPDGGTAGTGCLTATDTNVYVGKALPRDGASAGDNAAAATDEKARFLMAVAVEGNVESS